MWINLKGMKKIILKLADKIIIALNTQCYADGFSQVSFLKKEGVINLENKIKVFGEGSLSGVNFSRFDLKFWKPKKNKLLQQYGLDNSSKKIIFIGRITYDKGIIDLIKAFLILMERSRNYSLVLIGPIENNLNLIPNDIFHEIESSKKIFHFDFNSSPEIFYTIGGLVDSIVDNQTGILVSKKDSLSLANAIEEILEDDKKRKIMSELALKRAKFLFNSSIVNNYVMDEYLRLVDNTFKFIGSRS